ncbi:MAG: nucleoside monophosphate kinase [Wolbachia endosymbiont of Menacanthus eurysternus]|nr:MAG: nucleoside monophosphate kinase [Wolbachia endosymbiont of Menacanthus eurysternus]
MIIVIFGPPGSGKGTQSSLLSARYNLKLVSVGDLLRDIISSNSELGREIRNIVELGSLVQDRIMYRLLYNQLMLVDDNFLLDGFPRNLNQARFLTRFLLKKYNRDVDIVIELQLDNEVVSKRLRDRFICLSCKSIYSISSFKNDYFICVKCGSTRLKKRIDDSNLFSINKRISEYHIQIKNLREYYKDKLLIVDASFNIDQVRREIESKIFL